MDSAGFEWEVLTFEGFSWDSLVVDLEVEGFEGIFVLEEVGFEVVGLVLEVFGVVLAGLLAGMLLLVYVLGGGLRVLFPPLRLDPGIFLTPEDGLLYPVFDVLVFDDGITAGECLDPYTSLGCISSIYIF